MFFILAHNNAAISFSRGSQICFIDATRDFAIAEFTAIWWFVDSTLIYAQAAYAACDASPKIGVPFRRYFSTTTAYSRCLAGSFLGLRSTDRNLRSANA
ncbi:hypothetical protein T4D_14288 [Trichinella pseudospiralis]|uniref:Uncharacterized protein n=1 Tax=Trichinella pseudospiralis TaxID=6337 RepID=A0A0V1F7E0_TRIPS|nr:hypothetical protein T4D_14288 [Trichinella pseudospiralis]